MTLLGLFLATDKQSVALLMLDSGTRRSGRHTTSRERAKTSIASAWPSRVLDRLPTFARSVGRLSASQVVLDGELVAVRPDGVTTFPTLQAALSVGAERPPGRLQYNHPFVRLFLVEMSTHRGLRPRLRFLSRPRKIRAFSHTGY
jgi:hypothetical protein